MNLQEIRTKFIDHSGRYDLIGQDSGAPDYSVDNGADHFINAGQRFLDRRIVHQQSIERYAFNLSSGEYQFPVPNLRSPINVWMSDGEARTRLDWRSPRWIREKYAKPFEDVDTGAPLYWTRTASRIRNTSSLAGVTSALSEPTETDLDLFTDASARLSTIIANPGQWYATPSAKWSWDSSTGATYASADTITSLEVFYQQALTSDVTVTTTGASAAVTVFLLKHTGSGGSSFVASDTISGAGTTTVSPASSWDIIRIWAGNTSSGTVESVTIETTTDLFEDVADATTNTQPNILIMPPTDTARTAIVEGTFDTPELTLNEDTSWWTERFPHESIWAALYCLEVSYRNTQGANDWLSALDRSLRDISYDEAEYEATDFTELEG